MRTMHAGRPDRPAGDAPPASSIAGFHLLEVAVTMAVTLVILLGVMASITTASVTEMRSTESTASQMLLGQTIEELKNSDFDDLITFDGQFVTNGTVRADISVTYLTFDLVRVQVTSSSTRFPDATHTAVLLQADLD